jgi:hypothetical protein
LLVRLHARADPAPYTSREDARAPRVLRSTSIFAGRASGEAMRAAARRGARHRATAASALESDQTHGLATRGETTRLRSDGNRPAARRYAAAYAITGHAPIVRKSAKTLAVQRDRARENRPA